MLRLEGGIRKSTILRWQLAGCLPYQKNGAIVRKLVGHARLVGEQAYRQLRELYRAVRLYVNCFQPSMKLLAKYEEGEKVRRVYDAARTPLQRLLLSEILPAASQQYLNEVAQALDPLRLLDQLERLQQALWRGAESTSPLTHDDPVPSLLCFCVQDCLEGSFVPEEEIPVPASRGQRRQGEVLDWPRTSKDPFEGKWDLILSLVLAHPEWSGSDLFEEMQRLFPGCYRPSQQGTLQNGLRKIRARLLSRMQEPWSQEVIQRDVPIPVVAESDQHVQEADGHVHAVALPSVPPPTPASQKQAQGAASVVGQQSSTVEAIRSAAVSAFPAAPPIERTAEPGTRARYVPFRCHWSSDDEAGIAPGSLSCHEHRGSDPVLLAGAASQRAESQNAGMASDGAWVV